MKVAAVLAILVAALLGLAEAQPNIYCGKNNCYDVLGVPRDATKSDIRQAYRKLAMELHPDKNKAEDASEKFQQLAVAYETLKDDESRTDYDYMLDHPEEFYYNTYRYYRHKAAPKIGVMPIVLTLITVISLFQYFNQRSQHLRVLNNSLLNQKVRQQAKQEAEDRGLFEKKMTKEEKEEVLARVVKEKIDLRGVYAPPSVLDTLWVQIVISPYTLAKAVYWYADWYYRINYKKEEYTEEDKRYLLRKNFKLSEAKYVCMPEEWKEETWARECWDAKKCKAYTDEKKEEEHQKLINSSQYKRWKRWSKNATPASYNYND